MGSNSMMNTTDAKKREEAPDTMELVYVRCASCGKLMGVKRGHVTGTSHGICEECFRAEMKELEKDDPGSPPPNRSA